MFHLFVGDGVFLFVCFFTAELVIPAVNSNVSLLFIISRIFIQISEQVTPIHTWDSAAFAGRLAIWVSADVVYK